MDAGLVGVEGDGAPTGRDRSGGRSRMCGGGLKLLVTEVRGMVQVRCMNCARVWVFERGCANLWAVGMFSGHERFVYVRKGDECGG